MADLDNDNLLYHYTTARGLVGILKTGKLWATHVAYLNDSKEWVHGLELLQKARRTKIESDLIAVLGVALISPYVVCFSSLGDDLNQWRAYAANAAGYALGFDKEDLQKVGVDKVEYHDDPTRLDLDVDVEGAEQVKRMMNIVATTKDPAFAAEAEWRGSWWTSPGKPDVFLDDGGGNIRPRINWPVKLELPAIRKLILGPRAPAREATLLHQFILGHHRDRVSADFVVAQSVVPYVG